MEDYPATFSRTGLLGKVSSLEHHPTPSHTSHLGTQARFSVLLRCTHVPAMKQEPTAEQTTGVPNRSKLWTCSHPPEPVQRDSTTPPGAPAGPAKKLQNFASQPRGNASAAGSRGFFFLQRFNKPQYVSQMGVPINLLLRIVPSAIYKRSIHYKCAWMRATL